MMAKISEIRQVKLFFGIIYNSISALEECKKQLVTLYGPIDYISREYSFEFTNYYRDEMGDDLKRIFFSFENLIMGDVIAEIKIESNELEDKFTENGKRKINLDPGYLDYHKVVLASFKFGGQKIYIGKGIYADMTLWYRKGKFEPFAWTFLDFKDGIYDKELLEIRNLYKIGRKITSS